MGDRIERLDFLGSENLVSVLYRGNEEHTLKTNHMGFWQPLNKTDELTYARDYRSIFCFILL